MSIPHFNWLGLEVPFRDGESIASALTSAGIASFGPDANGRETRYFCGIGACQCCLVRVDDRIVEACLTPARDGQMVGQAENAND